MLCPRCGISNPGGNNFCQSCGASLALRPQIPLDPLPTPPPPASSVPPITPRTAPSTPVPPPSTPAAVPPPPPPPDPLDNVLSRSVPTIDSVAPPAPTPVSPLPSSGPAPSSLSVPVPPASAGVNENPHGGTGKRLLIIFIVIVGIGILLFFLMRRGIFSQPIPSGADNNIISQSPVPTKPQPTVSPVAKPSSVLSSQVYTSSKEGFKIYPPQGWQVDESGQIGTLVIFAGPIKDQFAVNINIVSESTQGLDFSSYIAASKENLPKMSTNYQLLEEKEVAVKGNNGYLIGGAFSAQGLQIRNLQLIVIANGKAYVVTATALSSQWDTYQEVFRSSLATFELTASSSAP